MDHPTENGAPVIAGTGGTSARPGWNRLKTLRASCDMYTS